MLDVKRMRVLREVAAQGSFSAAADALSYTQSAVSQQISALEREAGARLVERGARGIRLTEAGRALVQHADAIIARLADAEAELDAIAGLRGGRLRLATFPTAGATIIPRAVAAFRERHPGVELELAQAEPPDGVSGLRSGEWEIALSVDAAWDDPGEEGIDKLHLLEDPMYLVLPARHRLARKPAIRLQDLCDEPWMVGTTGSCPDARICLRACNGAGFEPKIAIASDDYLAIQGFIAAGVGVALIPDLGLIAVRDDIVIRELSGRTPPVRHIVAATLAGGYRSPAAQAMLDILAEVSEDYAQQRRSLALAS